MFPLLHLLQQDPARYVQVGKTSACLEKTAGVLRKRPANTLTGPAAWMLQKQLGRRMAEDRWSCFGAAHCDRPSCIGVCSATGRWSAGFRPTERSVPGGAARTSAARTFKEHIPGSAFFQRPVSSWNASRFPLLSLEAAPDQLWSAVSAQQSSVPPSQRGWREHPRSDREKPQARQPAVGANQPACSRCRRFSTGDSSLTSRSVSWDVSAARLPPLPALGRRRGLSFREARRQERPRDRLSLPRPPERVPRVFFRKLLQPSHPAPGKEGQSENLL